MRHCAIRKMDQGKIRRGPKAGADLFLKNSYRWSLREFVVKSVVGQTEKNSEHISSNFAPKADLRSDINEHNAA
jgi:hypothetical protein